MEALTHERADLVAVMVDGGECWGQRVSFWRWGQDGQSGFTGGSVAQHTLQFALDGWK